MKENTIREYEKYSYRDLRNVLEEYANRIKQEEKNPSDPQSKQTLYSEHESYYSLLFQKVLLTQEADLDELKDLMDMLFSNRMMREDSAGVLSALTLNIFKYPNTDKVLILLNLVKHPDPLIRQRALVGLYLAICRHEEMLMNDDLFMEQWSVAIQYEVLPAFMLTVIEELLIALETKDVIQRIDEELFPKIKSATQHHNGKKIDLTFIQEDPDDEDDDEEDDMDPDDNPEFQEMKDTICELNKMMDKGMDIHMRSFQQNKNYPFFHHLENWFYPFTFHHTVSYPIKDDYTTPQRIFVKMILIIGNFCYSDRWSLVHMTEKMQMDSNAIPEELNEEKLKEIMAEMYVSHDDNECRYYVEDLYRFFNLHALKDEYGDPFNMGLNPVEHPLLMQAFTKKKKRIALAGLLYRSDCYTGMIKLMEPYANEDVPESIYIRQKLGYACKQSGNAEEALKHYEIYLEHTKKPDEETLLNVAACYVKCQKLEEALKCYEKVEKRHPKDLRITKRIAECQVNLGHYEEALKRLFKIEYMEESTDMTRRAIVWCCFLTQQIPQALTYWERIQEKTLEDHLNAGHLNWAVGDTSAALSHYREYFSLAEDQEEAANTFREDHEELSRYGISMADIDLMIQAAR